MLVLTDAGFLRAQAFVYRKWCTRATERDEIAPLDLSRSCKYGSWFMFIVYGGVIEGNYQHQFNVIEGRIVDLSAGAADVLALRKPYQHDAELFVIEEYQASMDTCRPRALIWAREFEQAELVLSEAVVV